MPVYFKNDPHVLIHLEATEDWNSLYECCDGFLTENDFDKLAKYLNGNIQSIIIEKNYFDADYRNTFFNFFSKKFANYPSTTIRLNFFSRKIPKTGLYDLDRYQKDYVGYSVIRPNRVSSIGRTVLDPCKLHCICGHVCVSEYKVHILGAELSVKGFPYMSQDTDVTVCAHASCWMIFRYFSQRYRRYAEIWPYEVAQLTKDVSKGRLVPSKGLTAYQVTEMFSNFGFFPEIYIRQQYPGLFDQLLYIYVESGLPVVAGLSTHSHAITIIGHLSDFTKTPKSVPCTSDEYLSGLIANDDNHMPYHAIRKDAPKPKKGYWSNYKIEELDFFIVPLYEKIHLSAEYVIKLAEGILSDRVIGINALSKLIKKNQLTTRTFLTSSKSYKKFLRDNELPFGISKVYREMKMPKFIWVQELSTKSLFKDQKVIGEIIFDATANPHDRFAFLAIHYPDFLLLNDRDYLTNDPRQFSIHNVDTKKIEYYGCYINNLCKVDT